MKVYANYSMRRGFCFIKDEIPEEILKRCQSWRQVKEEYLKLKELCVMDIKNWSLDLPTDMIEDEED